MRLLVVGVVSSITSQSVFERWTRLLAAIGLDACAKRVIVGKTARCRHRADMHALLMWIVR